MERKIGFIGCGNMAKAMITGLLESYTAGPDYIMASSTTAAKLEAARRDYGIATTSDNREVAQFADILVLSVKPNKYRDVIEEIKVGEAMTALCSNGRVTQEELKAVYDIFGSFGLVEIIDEELLDVITAVSASSSAGGTAIEAVYSLEKKGFRGHVIEAIQRCTEKAEKLGAGMNGGHAQ